MNATDEPMAPWAFRAAISGLPAEETRDILESERCPEPDEPGDWVEHVRSLPLDDEGESIIVCQTAVDGAWIQSDEHVALDDSL